MLMFLLRASEKHIYSLKSFEKCYQFIGSNMINHVLDVNEDDVACIPFM